MAQEIYKSRLFVVQYTLDYRTEIRTRWNGRDSDEWCDMVKYEVFVPIQKIEVLEIDLQSLLQELEAKYKLLCDKLTLSGFESNLYQKIKGLLDTEVYNEHFISEANAKTLGSMKINDIDKDDIVERNEYILVHKGMRGEYLDSFSGNLMFCGDIRNLDFEDSRRDFKEEFYEDDLDYIESFLVNKDERYSKLS